MNLELVYKSKIIGFYNQFQLLKIKISEAFNNIDILFEKKLNLLERTITIIKENNKKYKDAQLFKLEYPGIFIYGG